MRKCKQREGRSLINCQFAEYEVELFFVRMLRWAEKILASSELFESRRKSQDDL